MTARDSDNWPAHETQARAIADALGTAWTAVNDSRQPDEWQNWTLVRDDGLTLGLGWPNPFGRNAGKPRLEIRGQFPKDAAGDLKVPSQYGELANAPTSISVDVTKRADVIAKDIQRRLIDGGYDAVYKELAARVDSANAYADQTAATVARIVATIPGASASRHNGRDTGGGIYTRDNAVYSITAQGDSVRFEAFSVPVDVAIAILKLTREGATS